jgi:oxaloacetate decarboxylase alpha subunit
MILEAMKMETEVRASSAGTIAQILVKEGETVQVGTPLLSLS